MATSGGDFTVSKSRAFLSMWKMPNPPSWVSSTTFESFVFALTDFTKSSAPAIGVPL